MIFLVGLLIWLFLLCDQPVDLILPVFLVCIRSGYLRRRVTVFHLPAIFFSVFFFLAPLVFQAVNIMLGRESSFAAGVMQSSAFMALRIYASALLIVNIGGDPTVWTVLVRLLGKVKSLGNMMQYMHRYPHDLRTRMFDIFNAYRMRRSSDHSRTSVFRLIMLAATTMAIEFVTVSNRLSVVSFARGDTPHLEWWKRPTQTIYGIFLSDALIILTGLVAGFAVSSRFGH